MSFDDATVIGKTIAAVTRQSVHAQHVHYDETVSVERIVLTFTDGTSVSIDASTQEVWADEAVIVETVKVRDLEVGDRVETDDDGEMIVHFIGPAPDGDDAVLLLLADPDAAQDVDEADLTEQTFDKSDVIARLRPVA